MRRILNVGCGPDTYGSDFVDLYPARPDVKRWDASTQPLPYPDDAFDEVYSKNLFEHLENPMTTLREMVRVAKPGGRIRVITDNAGWLLFHLPLRRSNYLEHYSNEPRESEGDRHYLLVTPLHLRNFFLKAGLQIDDVSYHYYSQRRAAKALLRVLRLLERSSLRHLLFPHLEIVGRKSARTRPA